MSSTSLQFCLVVGRKPCWTRCFRVTCLWYEVCGMWGVQGQTLYFCFSAQESRDVKKQRHYFANKGPSSQGYGFSSGQVWM